MTATINIPELGGLLHYRPEGSDRGTIDDVLAGYHLPPEWYVPKQRIYDLGAYAGYTARDFALRYPEVEIIAVEMDAESAALAEENARGHPTIMMINAAVVGAPRAAQEALVRYRRNPGGQNAHRLDPDGDETAHVTCLAFLAELFGPADYIKVDIEGAELEALQGWTQPGVISVECHDGLMPDVATLLRGNGYEVEFNLYHPSSLTAWRF